MYRVSRCYSGAVSRNGNVSSALKSNEESTAISVLLNLGGNTKAFVPFGGEGLFLFTSKI